MPATNRRPSLVRSAGQGALAGLIGGAAMAAAERVLIPRLPGRRAPRIVPLDARVSDIAERLGWDMSPRARVVAGVTTQLVYATLLGAAYGALLSRQPSRSTRQLVEAVLQFAASLLAPELPRARVRRPPARGGVTRLRQKVLEPVTPFNVFGQTTGMALRALMR